MCAVVGWVAMTAPCRYAPMIDCAGAGTIPDLAVCGD